MSKVNLKDIKAGDVFSEESHYIFQSVNGNKYAFKHLESGENIVLGSSYVQDLLSTADQFEKEVEVGREDKFWTAAQIAKEPKGNTLREGDLKVKGIRSIWNDIHNSGVFTVSFNKQDKELSTKALTEAREKQTKEAVDAIIKAQKNKKGIAQAAIDAINIIQNNPIVPIEKGEERILRGYKTQFESITGNYSVVDMDITTGSNKRQVNVNEINWLVYRNVRYIVK